MNLIVPPPPRLTMIVSHAFRIGKSKWYNSSDYITHCTLWISGQISAFLSVCTPRPPPRRNNGMPGRAQRGDNNGVAWHYITSVERDLRCLLFS